MPTEALQTHEISTAEARNVAVDFSGKLESSELLTGTPTVSEVGGSDLVITNEQVSTAALEINGPTIAAGKAVQFKVDASAATAGESISVDVSVGSDGSQTLVGRVTLNIIA